MRTRAFSLVFGLSALAFCASIAQARTDANGVGLKLGKVVNTIPVGSSIGPWLVWDKRRCSYQTTQTHPKAYVANVRKVVGGPTKIGYMHYGDTDPFGVANSKNMKKMAALAGFTARRLQPQVPVDDRAADPGARPRCSRRTPA